MTTSRWSIAVALALLAICAGGAPAAQAVDPSQECTTPTTTVLDGMFGGVYLRVRVQQNGTSSVWVCVRADGAGQHLGGKVVVEPLGLGGVGAPSVDDTSTACHTTPGNLVPTAHPLIGSTIANQQVLLDVYASASEAWVCVALNDPLVTKRVKIPISAPPLGSVRFEEDPDSGSTDPPPPCPSGQVGVSPACVDPDPDPSGTDPDDTLGAAGCLVSGLTGQAAADSLEKDLALNPESGPEDGGAPGWLLDTDSGNFTFGGTATCGVVDVASRTPYTQAGGWAVGAGSSSFFVNAQGTFANLVCSTGTIDGWGNIRGGTNLLVAGNTGPAGATDVDFEFGITLAGGVGALSMNVSPGADGGSGGNEVGPNQVTGGTGYGAIDFLPTQGSCFAGHGVTGFTVNAAFTMSLSGDGDGG